MEQILQHIDLIGLIVDILALIATVALTVAIYKLERRHTIEREALEKKEHKRNVTYTANVFLIDNDEESEYLPLCAIASKLNLKRKHHRTIFTRFLRCQDEVQAEILHQANIEEYPISRESVNHAIACLREDIAKAQLGYDFLYDGAKYFHRAIELYSDYAIPDVNPSIFEPIEISPALKALRKDYKWDFFSYTLKYINKSENFKMIPPIMMAWNQCGLGSCPEPEMTFWAMRMIIDCCKALHDCGLPEECPIQTQEDMYYYTLLILYKTYCMNNQVT